jgi:hypothetical protein
MFSQPSLRAETIDRIRQRLQGGMMVWRGVYPHYKAAEYVSDPGDFGRGVYYTTLKSRAKSYGEVSRYFLQLSNPLVLSVSDAYDLSETFGKIRTRTLDQSEAMTLDLIAQGYDGIVSVSIDKERGFRNELEIVDFRPYKQI